MENRFEMGWKTLTARSGAGFSLLRALARLLVCVNFCSLALALVAALPAFAARQNIPFEHDWRFLKADAPGAESRTFDDSAWRKLDLPHDWAIEGPFDQKNPAGGAGAFLPSGFGWYRKSFTLPSSDSGRRVFVEFDGIMANSDVWINGFHLGKRPYGYVSLQYELTGHVDFGKPNVLAVRADTSAQPASRWYAGAGIYRHVRLVVTDPVHLEHWGTIVTVTGDLKTRAMVHVRTTVVNQSATSHNVLLDVVVLDPAGHNVATAVPDPRPIAAGKTAVYDLDLPVESPELWDLDHPAVYRVGLGLTEGGNVLDTEAAPFGIRDFKFDAATGFWINRRNIKIKGVCLHGDAGGLGVAVPISAWERRLQALKKTGVNAVRTAHNPPSPDFLDLCDRMGILVMDEMFDCWTVAKNPHDYHLYFRDWSAEDTRDTVRRDRNHPSIVVYSAGNEIHDTPHADLSKEILGGLLKVFHENDPTRPVTQALFRPNVSHDYDDGLADMLDVIGQNYRENEILAAHEAKPTRKILGTENQHGRSVWVALRDNPAYAGQFLWSGIDYLGESRMWPVVASGSGLLDRTGGMKPMAYERQSWWSAAPMVHITRRVAPPPVAATDPGYEPGVRRFVQTLFSDWSPTGAKGHEENVEVYSNCEEVELMLNGHSLGVKPLNSDASPRNWRVPFEEGTMQAIGRNGGKEVARDELRTAGKPARIILEADRPRISMDWDDVATVRATIVDGNWTPVPSADALVQFQIEGPGAIIAVDNADNSSHEPFQASERHAWEGRCIAVVRGTKANSRFKLTATSPGLAAANLTVETGVAK